MTQNQNVLEVTGKDVESAIEKGLAKLGLKRSDVIVDVVEEGSKGFLGLGSKESVVRLTSLVARRQEPVVTPPVAKPAPEPTPVVAPKPEPVVATPAPTPKAPVVVAIQEEDIDHEANAVAVKGIVEALLEKMAVEANVNVSVSEPDSVSGKRFLAVEIDGDDVSVLIGPRGEALNALQYVLRLMSGHQLRQRVNILLDVANYREKRRQAISRMATRMAEKVTTKDRPVTLEPMPPFERRVVHMSLRDDSSVYTQSIGNGDRRRVRIYPKRN